MHIYKAAFGEMPILSQQPFSEQKYGKTSAGAVGTNHQKKRWNRVTDGSRVLLNRGGQELPIMFPPDGEHSSQSL